MSSFLPDEADVWRGPAQCRFNVVPERSDPSKLCNTWPLGLAPFLKSDCSVILTSAASDDALRSARGTPESCRQAAIDMTDTTICPLPTSMDYSTELQLSLPLSMSVIHDTRQETDPLKKRDGCRWCHPIPNYKGFFEASWVSPFALPPALCHCAFAESL